MLFVGGGEYKFATYATRNVKNIWHLIYSGCTIVPACMHTSVSSCPQNKSFLHNLLWHILMQTRAYSVCKRRVYSIPNEEQTRKGE